VLAGVLVSYASQVAQVLVEKTSILVVVALIDPSVTSQVWSAVPDVNVPDQVAVVVPVVVKLASNI
jgi:hypothetical protein